MQDQPLPQALAGIRVLDLSRNALRELPGE
jgi:hypothetical protein